MKLRNEPGRTSKSSVETVSDHFSSSSRIRSDAFLHAGVPVSLTGQSSMIDCVNRTIDDEMTRNANIVMLGAAFGTGLMPIREETIKAALETHFPAKLLAVNLKAFDLGYRHCQQAVCDNSA